MGKKKVGFIDKSKAQKFHLVYRSERDEAYAQEGTPSQMVLIPAEELASRPQRASSIYSQNHKRKDHINELGFANDGYDYSQHLLELGSTYIDKSGNIVQNYTGKIVDLPEEVLPSAGELQRDFEAITISEELMDEDIRAALFDENEEFEELDDDFVQQVLSEPVEPDFDFDAHIRDLIAKSEQKLGLNHGRKESNQSSKGVSAEEDEDEYFELDEEFMQMMGKGSDAVEMLSDEQKQLLEVQLDKALEEYDDEEIGGLDDHESEDLEGEIELEGDDALDQALDEFLEEQKTRIQADRSNYKKGKRSTLTLENVLGEEEHQENDETTVDIKREYEEQLKLQETWEEEIKQMDLNDAEYDEVIESMREVKIKDEWDCETILSTYSTLDNHPTLVKNTNSKFKPYKTRYQRKMEADERNINSLNNSKKDGIKPAVEKHLSVSGKPEKIILGGKMNLPVDYVNSSNMKSKPTKIRPQKLEALNESEEDSDNGEIREDEYNRNEGNEDDDFEQQSSDSEEESENRRGKRKETPEEKKARKAKVKEEKRLKRANKKAIKTQFKAEGIKIVKSLAKESSTDHYTVYKY